MTSTSGAIRTTPRHSTPLHKGAILTIILVSYFMILLDNSVIFTALPSLQADLQLTGTELAWVQNAYTLVFGGLLLLGARAGDILGRKPVFIFGLIVFSVASLLIALSPAGWWLITARAIQGIGAAIVAPSALSLITATFQGTERSRAVAWYSATAGIGASLGLVVGGAMASWFSWRAGFFINVPIGLAMLILAPRFLPRTPALPGRFDITGAITSTLGVGSLVFAILNAAENGWADPATVIGFVSAAVILTVFIVAESRAAQPIMPLRLFASRFRTGAYLTRLLYLGAMIGFFFFTSQYLQEALGFTPLQAGLAFLPMTLVNFAVAIGIPRLTARLGNTVLLIVGVTLTLAGMFWLSRIGPDSTYLTAVALPMLLIGAGQGLAFAPMTTFGITGATATDAGAASGVVNTFHQVGSSLGLGILVAVAGAAASGSTGDVAATITTEAGAALTAGSIFLFVSLVIVLALIAPASAALRRTHTTATTTGARDIPAVKSSATRLTGSTTRKDVHA
ncbi:EmrB/QacA subfamily drug resistance transporter [Microbacterium terrae]|uniref:MFS-type transporter EfpA n=1 Tax=Microbacterium terrae TaxID=69369 RepID=A0A0M2GXC2_9MICO|nr:MFS transporter [Microbacterium terrae]KJL38399.1 putative MFS-type transporter EfpA [Microbacterium terrae]MBP1078959.1 EmrB/QacA subfamily drug resistance transporter [Microbacterium terrae]GLJ98359.1 MFS transporter [Microbacterium terrae]